MKGKTLTNKKQTNKKDKDDKMQQRIQKTDLNGQPEKYIFFHTVALQGTMI